MRIPKRSFEDEAQAASGRLLRRAARDGLLDVAYDVVESPLGPLVAAVTAKGLARLAYDEEASVLEQLSRSISPRVLHAPSKVAPVRRQLDQYFAGRRRAFDLDLDLELVGGFSRRVLRAAARIPFGAVRTYTQVATTAGSPRASRAAGNALGGNPIPIVVPCHRVVHAGGGLGGYTGGLERKEFLLELEGVLEPG